MTAVLAYQFEEEPVRVVMIAGEPWFVANDLCKALTIANSRHALERLDEDEKGVALTDTLGGQQSINVVSESGMFALVLGSRKQEARRFRKWVTSVVLPSIRKTGRFELDGFDPPPLAPGAFDPIALNAQVAVVREARRLFGPEGARSIWTQVGLPAPIVDAVPQITGDNWAEPLKAWLEGKTETTALWAAKGIGLTEIDRMAITRIAALLKLFGWVRWAAKRDGVKVNLYYHPDHVPASVAARAGGEA
jgi:hypothetical protein